MENCSKCDGKGEIRCSRCGGFGCLSCHDYGSVTCPECNGTGQIEELGIARMKAQEMSRMSKEAISLYTQGRKDEAIQILKKMADNGSVETLAVLKKWGVDYTPQKPSASGGSSVPVKKKINYTDGTVYEGDVVDGKCHGKGKIIYPDGKSYEGEWVNNDYKKGKMIYPSGSVYEGDWFDGEPHGKGKFTLAKGAVLEGDWNNGEMYRGKFTYANGKIWHDGEWENGEPKKSKGLLGGLFGKK
jgi:hypothetical protein